jgi:hypothetical protein
MPKLSDIHRFLNVIAVAGRKSRVVAALYR